MMNTQYVSNSNGGVWHVLRPGFVTGRTRCGALPPIADGGYRWPSTTTNPDRDDLCLRCSRQRRTADPTIDERVRSLSKVFARCAEEASSEGEARAYRYAAVRVGALLVDDEEQGK